MNLPRLLLLLLVCPAAFAEPVFVHCYDFGCKSTQEIRFSSAQWQELRALFADRKMSAPAEKQAIRRAVAAMERFSGAIAGTDADVGGNGPGQGDYIRQMDCIDESTNTAQYLAALDQLGLLRWHRAGMRQRRIVWLATHWTATITEKTGGGVFAVDSWYLDNGELPYLQPLQDWRRKRDFPAAYNPELAAE